MNRKLWRTGTLVLPSLLVAASLLLPAGVAAGAGGLTAAFAKSSDWGTGYVGVYTIRNAGTTSVSGWRLEVDLPASAPVTGWWNGALTRSGTHITVVNDTWNGTLAPGASTTFGFQVESSVAPPAPAGCTLNGAPCSGGTSRPSSTTTTTTRPTTTTTKPTTTTVPPPPGGGVFAPYADVTLWPPIDLTDTAAASGVTQFTLAFIVNGSGPCQAAWGGVIPLAENFLVDEVGALRAQGGDVIVSFGGAAGQELAQSCGTVAALVSQYQAVIDTYGLTKIDFDIEGAATAEPASVARRSQAIATLQSQARAAGRKLSVSLTLPVLPTGLTADGLAVVRSARDAGVDLSVVNVMAMDYGDWAAPNPAGRMGQYAIDAATSLEGQLQSLYPGRTPAQLARMVGITPMIGQNDVPSEVFTLADADRVLTFARQQHVGRLSMWSVARDKQCPGGTNAWADPTCSGILQAPYAFSSAFRTFTG